MVSQNSWEKPWKNPWICCSFPPTAHSGAVMRRGHHVKAGHQHVRGARFMHVLQKNGWMAGAPNGSTTKKWWVKPI